MKKRRYSDSLPGLPSVNDTLESSHPVISSAADVSSSAMDPSHPSGGFGTFISGGRVDQSQPITAGIGATRELILVHQDEIQGLRQLIRAVAIPEPYTSWMGRRSSRPVVADQILFTPGSNRPDAQVIQRSSGFTSVFNPG